ncbi:outer membrane beta-barrel family protein [Mucilaginibacter myungsuensis]
MVGRAQTLVNFSLLVIDEKAVPIQGATVKLLQDNKMIKGMATDAKGLAVFSNLKGSCTFLVSLTSYQPQTRTYQFPSNKKVDTIRLNPATVALQEVNVASRPPQIEHKQGKTIVNVESSVTITGMSVLEILERSPGVTVDRSGGISMQGKNGVLVMIDDKPTYISGSDLNDMLSAMNSGQVSEIELITNPSAKYDAAGNAGIINIKTKKTKQIGFNGQVTASGGHGIYPKANDNLLLNFKSGKVSSFFNYSYNYAEYLTKIYALREYFNSANGITSTLDQPSYFTGTVNSHTIKTGLDYAISPKTTLGLVLTGATNKRKGDNDATATWLNNSGGVDSAISTTNISNNKFRNGMANLNLRHNISPKADIGADIDVLHYDISADQAFNNHLLAPGGYTELSKGDIPTTIDIVTGKVDYSLKNAKNDSWLFGAKASRSNTDNTAYYQNFLGGNWVDDNSRSNHFIYKEQISAAYSSWEAKRGKFSWQLGLRYEQTNYDAHQLGNAIQRDSSFSRNYGGFFPSGYLTWQTDKNNGLTASISRRIERPAFQKLNPFYFIINKYTYQTGNAFILPQYTLNFELSHQYKSWLTNTVSYSSIDNYFSQIFLNDGNKGILLYTQGNVGHAYNFNVQSMVVLNPTGWWSTTATALYTHKQLKGFNGNTVTATADQLNISTTNQFTIAKKYTAELSGYYLTSSRIDIQEQLYPSGQLSIGLSKSVFNKKGTLRINARDLFYTNWLKGLTDFPTATEYFKLQRDTRVVMVSLTYRFGKTYKVNKRSDGSASDEMQRVGNG